MALDAQSNWNVEMALPLRLTITTQPKVSPELLDSTESLSISQIQKEEVPLPLEIILHIISYVPQKDTDQKTLWACCLVSRLWYSAAIPLLYERPYIGGHNFLAFVATVCPSKNAHIRRSHLAELVKKLDMGALVHDGSKSLTARLLGRLKSSLSEFVAPQASFSVNSFAALSKCKQLTHLNLSLMSASISIKLMFQTLQALSQLETLFFPRTSGTDLENDKATYRWPPKLKALHLAGGVDDTFLRLYVCNVPLSLERLSIQHCPQIHTGALQQTLENIGPQLRHLTVRHPMNRLVMGALDEIFMFCPNLVALRISADYITDLLFNFQHILPPHPLRILELECSDSADSNVGISPDGIWVAIESGFLADLRSIRVSARLAWQATLTLRRSVSDLIDILVEQDAKVPLGIEPGVWSIAS